MKFADDTLPRLSSPVGRGIGVYDQRRIDVIKEWTKNSKVQLNTNKSREMLIARLLEKRLERSILPPMLPGMGRGTKMTILGVILN